MRFARLCVVFLCCLSSLFCVAQESSYLSFEVPGALGTYPMSINNSMAVTGYYLVSPTAARSFLRQPDGTMITFNVPASLWTESESINDDGDIVGFYEAVAGIPRGFARYADGRLITFDPPGFVLNGPQAQPISINAFKVIAGNFPYPLAASYGFTRLGDEPFKTFGFGLGALYATVVTGLNASGTVTGYVSEDAGATTGFLLHRDGFFLQFAVPVAGDSEQSFNFSTIADSVNADGVTAGWYVNCTYHCGSKSTGGFVRSPEGLFTLFNPPGTLLTEPLPGFPVDNGSLVVPHWISINREGSIAGSYTDAQGAQHGFVRNPYGTITGFDPPRGGQTTATAINDSGVITGTYHYVWDSQTLVGFLRIPKH